MFVFWEIQILAAIDMRHIIIIILFFCSACNTIGKKKDNSETKDTSYNSIIIKNGEVSRNDTIEKYCYQTSPFLLIKEFPKIKDTSRFIQALKENCHLYEEHSNSETINYFKKIKLYGSSKQFYLIEYDFHDGPTAGFPWKQQLIFDTTGKFIQVLSDIRVDVVKIFPKENAFLIGISATGHGNGGHGVYRISSDTLEQIYSAFLGSRPQTYDTNEDNSVNEPYEFHYKIIDVNNDGYNDIKFFGKIVLIQARAKNGDWYDQETINGKTIYYSVDHPFKKIPAVYNFLYNPMNGHFEEQEDYSKKYEYLFGDTK
jgi:hypothetical protein